MKNIVPSIALISVVIAGCNKDSLTVGPQEQEVATRSISTNVLENVHDVPVDAVFFNECCNEAVLLNGTAHIVITENIMHIGVFNITGIGLSTGYSYVSLSPSVQNNVFYASQFEGTLTFMLHMKNAEGCSFQLRATLHTTLNEIGEITAVVEKIETRCQN